MKTIWQRGGGWVLAQFGLLALAAFAPFISTSRLPWPGLAHVVIGAGLIVLGLFLIFAGATTLGTSLTPLPHPRDDSSLRTTGIYHLVRHPIYGGLILGATGYGVCLASPVALFLALLTLIFFDRKAAKEEVWLRERYPSYADYAQRTRRFLPWLF